jgi:mono/diheme cytochrome c family protein
MGGVVKRALKIVGSLLAVMVVVIGMAAVAGKELGERKANRLVNITVSTVTPAGDAGAIARGKYLYESRGCMECHGKDGRGLEFINDPGGLFVRAANVTAGRGGAVQQYADIDWVRTIRHGVKPSGKPLLIMPSEDYNRMTDGDLTALVAYVRSLPPVEGQGAEVRLPLLVKTLYAVGLVKDAAEKIDHALPPSVPVPAGVTVAHGAYVANMCIGCHGQTLSGGKIPGGPPDWPPAANLTPGKGGVMVNYDSPDKFRAMLRTGKRPDGSDVSKVMPFKTLEMINDIDAEAVYAYLKTVAPRDAGNR